MTIHGGSIFIHYPAVGAECKLLPLVFPIIDVYPRQAVSLVKLANHILSFRLKQHVRGHDGYQGAISLSFDERAYAGYILCDPSSGVKGKPLPSNLKSLGLHWAMRPSLSRWLIQCSPMIAGEWDSSAAHLSQKVREESNTFWVTSSLLSSLRIKA